MRAIGFGMLALCLMGSGEMWGNKVVPVENDTIKTYQMGEVIITSSTKETNAFKSIPGAVSPRKRRTRSRVFPERSQ